METDDLGSFTLDPSNHDGQTVNTLTDVLDEVGEVNEDGLEELDVPLIDSNGYHRGPWGFGTELDSQSRSARALNHMRNP